MLFSTINRLLRPIDAPQPTDALNLSSKFLDFFQAKVDSIYQQLLQPASPPLHIHVTHRMCLPSFSPVDASRVVELVTKAKASTCPLDSMPTTLVKACLPTLCPIMVDIINTSLESGIVPSSFKMATVTPILKKPGLDPDRTGRNKLSHILFHPRPLNRLSKKSLVRWTPDYPPDGSNSRLQYLAPSSGGHNQAIRRPSTRIWLQLLGP
ncbi:hypothetical protein SKAU_G00248370 [Synaphobranchus kaupii]|uniref:Reverse transcriptase n=1 Tax=Synaphobranchus kaupii TaxID=118154 RepID=A0A9Q1F2B8_SYNKA|nr:hypothetical protein SKAU_G00248370 [Synaphobranchus kaupii]